MTYDILHGYVIVKRILSFTTQNKRAAEDLSRAARLMRKLSFWY